MTIVLSQELSAIAAEFISRHNEVSLDEIRDTGRLLAGLSQLAFSQERELEIHRLRELGQANIRTVGELVDTHTAEILRLHRQTDGKVIRPDFTKGGRS
ncbi:hypothetical protein ACQKGC_15875 [Allorhizobium pseudoryzae]|uniref:hypothetical protein n=1 Tax=Allorhizobium pseudoryzae TaxID=379684 RepID=UPI003D04C0D8